MNVQSDRSDSGSGPVWGVSPTPMQIIDGAKAGDSLCWQQLARLYSPYIYVKCRRHNFSRHDAAEVVQDVFLTLVKTFHQFGKTETHHRFRGWLHELIRTRMADHVTNRKRQTGDSELMPSSEIDSRPSAACEERDGSISDFHDQPLFDYYVSILETEFETQTWQAFWKVVAEGRSVSDVADELGLTKNTVRKYKSRILKRLRDEFGEG